MMLQRLVLLGLSLVTLVGGEKEAMVSPRICPLGDESGRSMYHNLHDRAGSCVSTFFATIGAELEEATNETQVKQAYKKLCDQRSVLEECLAALKTEAELCLNGVIRTRFQLFTGYRELSVVVGCAGGGQRLADIYRGRESSRPSPLESCRNTGDSRVWVGIQRDPNLDMVLEYFMLQSSLACLEKHRGGEDDTLVDAGLALWTEILENMECIDKGSPVPCKIIVNAGAV